MYKIAVLLLVALLFGCQTTEIGESTPADDQSAPVAESPASNVVYDITYKVEENNIGNADKPLDIYILDIYKDDNYTVKFAKYIATSEAYYFLSFTYVGLGKNFMRNSMAIDIDGFVSNFTYGAPFRADSSEGVTTEIVTVILSNFVVNDMRSAASLRFLFENSSPIEVTPVGIEHTKRFITEMEGEDDGRGIWGF